MGILSGGIPPRARQNPRQAFVIDIIRQYQNEAQDLRNQAKSLNVKAEHLEEKASYLKMLIETRNDYEIGELEP